MLIFSIPLLIKKVRFGTVIFVWETFMNKFKVMTVVGTRPEIIRLSRVMSALDRYMDQIIVHTGKIMITS